MPSLSTITRAVATTEDRRGTLAAAGMIAAVVAVLAFGSGSWGRIARLAGDSALPAGRDLGTAVQPLPGATAGSGEVAVGVVPGTRGSSGARSGSSSSTSTASRVVDVELEHHVGDSRADHDGRAPRHRRRRSSRRAARPGR